MMDAKLTAKTMALKIASSDIDQNASQQSQSQSPEGNSLLSANVSLLPISPISPTVPKIRNNSAHLKDHDAHAIIAFNSLSESLSPSKIQTKEVEVTRLGEVCQSINQIVGLAVRDIELKMKTLKLQKQQAQSTQAKEQVKEQAIALLMSDLEALADLGQKDLFAPGVLIQSVERNNDVIKALADVLFEYPEHDGRTHLDRFGHKSSGVRTLRVRDDKNEMKTFFLTNRSSDRGKYLGYGAYATVRAALAENKVMRDKRLPDTSYELAVKKIKPKNTKEVIRAFREAQISRYLSDLKHGPHIEAICIFDSYKNVSNKTLCATEAEKLSKNIGIIMEKGYPFIPLPERILHSQKASDQQKVKIRLHHYLQMAQDIQRMHCAGYIHNDLRLSNVIMDSKSPKNANAKLVDFGLSLNQAISLPHNGLERSMLGGAHPSPEAIDMRNEDNAKALDPLAYKKFDLWALGQLLVQEFFPTLNTQSKLNQSINPNRSPDIDRQRLIEYMKPTIEALSLESFAGNALAQLTLDCLNLDAQKRINIDQFITSLSQILSQA